MTGASAQPQIQGPGCDTGNVERVMMLGAQNQTWVELREWCCPCRTAVSCSGALVRCRQSSHFGIRWLCTMREVTLPCLATEAQVMLSMR